MAKTKKRFLGIGVLAAIAVITIAFAIAASGSDGGVIEQNAEGVTVAALEVTSSISYQGRLTDSAGEPLSGSYDMTFRLYEVASGGSARDTDTHAVEVTEGLFNTEIYFAQEYFDGRELWLGITVGGEEMSPRQEFKPVPYALSLKPGAVINGSVHGAILDVTNTYGDWSQGVIVSISGDYSDGIIAATQGNYSDGVFASATGDYSDGVQAHTSGDNSAGVSVITSGENSDGVWASTTGDDSDGVRAYSAKNYGVYGKGGKYGGYFTTDRAGTSRDDMTAGVYVTTD